MSCPEFFGANDPLESLNKWNRRFAAMAGSVLNVATNGIGMPHPMGRLSELRGMMASPSISGQARGNGKVGFCRPQGCGAGDSSTPPLATSIVITSYTSAGIR